jgi:alpha-galactosidase
MAVITLTGRHTCLVLEESETGPPIWRYWGPRIEDPGAVWSPLREQRPTPTFAPDSDAPLSLFPTFGGARFEPGALLAHRAGRDFHQAFLTEAIEWTLPGQAIAVRLRDAVTSLEVRLTLAINPGTDVVTLSSRLTNVGDGVADVQWLAAGVLPLPPQCDAVRSFAGRHLDEFHPLTDRLGRSGWRRENRRGLTSHSCFPGAVAVTGSTTLHAGLAFGAQLAWSGNHAQQIDWLDDGRFQWMMGEWLAPGEIRLGPGQSIASPDMVAVCSQAGLNGVAQAFHAEARRRLTWPGGAMRLRPVSLNTWEGFYFRHDLDELKALADAAAKVGVERFVLDDGWFRGRDDDTAGLGDWRPHAGKYPQGLGPLIDHVTGLGLEFGLWVEPEMVNADSDLFREHPDWALGIEGRPPITARHQLVLDLARAEVADHLFQAIGALLARHPIAYLKWDHNRDLIHAADREGRAAYHRQVDAAYGLMRRLRAAHPQVEIEACAGGGGRIDLGVLAHTHRVWTSDNIDAVSRHALQRGFLQFFPPEIMGAHVGANPAHTTGRSQSMDFRAAVALPGHFGVELDLRRLTDRDRERLAAWIALYKALREELHHGPVWLGEGADGLTWQAHGDAKCLLLFVYRATPATFPHTPTILLPMVAGGGAYRIERLDPAGAGSPPEVIGAARLRHLGLPTPRLKAERCAILRLTLIEGSSPDAG